MPSGASRAGAGEGALGNSSGDFVLPTSRAIQTALASFTTTPGGASPMRPRWPS